MSQEFPGLKIERHVILSSQYGLECADDKILQQAIDYRKAHPSDEVEYSTFSATVPVQENDTPGTLRERIFEERNRRRFTGSSSHLI